MKPIELYDYFLEKSGVDRNRTCDGILAGDGERDVQCAVTCFKATVDIIRKAAENNIPLIVCHEPMFGIFEEREKAFGYERKKWELLDETGVTVLRLHDCAHSFNPDYIHTGFINKMGLKIKRKFENECMGICRYELDEPTTPRTLAEKTKNALGAEYPRIVGDKDIEVKYICLALGGIGAWQVRVLEGDECDLLITGEIGEVNDCNYLRDLNSFGVKGSMLMLGHFTSEWAGMELMAKDIADKFGIKCEYVDSHEVY